jgi:hypothetical protein
MFLVIGLVPWALIYFVLTVTCEDSSWCCGLRDGHNQSGLIDRVHD